MTEETKQTEINPKENVPNPEITQKMESIPPIKETPVELQTVETSNADQKTWCMLCHLSALCGLISVPPVIGPLVIWLIKKDTMPEVDKHGKEAINFQLSFLIYWIVSGILCFILIGIPMIFVLAILWLIFTIIGSVKASNGELYHYPMTIRFLK